MLFGNNYKKETKAFMEIFKSVFSTMQPIGFSKADVSEALYAMYLICDYAAKDSGKDRKKLGLAIIQKINSSIWELDYDEMLKRVGFYEDVLEKNFLRVEGMPPLMTEVLPKDTATKIGIILTDILYNPACKEDYVKAEFKKFNDAERNGFSLGVAAPIIGLLGRLYNEIAK